jgi:hypothetical protein
MFMEGGGIRSLGFRSGMAQVVLCHIQLNDWQTESRYSPLHLPQATLLCGTSTRAVGFCT